MADTKERITLNQALLDRNHKMLDQLIRTTEQVRVQSCEDGDFTSRDKLDKINAHLRMARSEAGTLNFNGVQPTTRGGDK